MGATITNIEYVYPKKVITNKQLSQEFPDYDFDKFENKVGIKERYIVSANETALDLACKAVEKLFSNGVNKDSIDYILYCTQTPEYILPTTACILQNKIGLKTNIGAFDFNLGCSGYTYGLSFAKSLIDSGQAENVLLVTAEVYSKHIYIKDRTNRSIFGDAATATIITKTKKDNISNFKFGTDGSGYDKLIIKNGGDKNRYDYNSEIKEYGTGNRYSDNHIYMNGPEIFNFTAKEIPTFTKSLLIENNYENKDISQFIFHQANAFMLNFMRRRLKIDEEKFYINLEKGGNTVSNTIPIALKEYSQSITKPEKIVLVGFGVGLSWSGGIISLNKKL